MISLVSRHPSRQSNSAIAVLTVGFTPHIDIAGRVYSTLDESPLVKAGQKDGDKSDDTKERQTRLNALMGVAPVGEIKTIVKDWKSEAQLLVVHCVRDGRADMGSDHLAHRYEIRGREVRTRGRCQTSRGRVRERSTTRT